MVLKLSWYNNRMKMNGIYGAGGYTQYGIGLYDASHGVNTSGYVLLSDNPASSLFNDNSGAWSMLHLNEGSGSVPDAYRPWMKAGITYTAGSDISYVGYRILSPDRTEMTIAWSDDSGVEYGPDDMVFRFLGWASAGNAYSVNSNNTLTNDLDGRHIARFTPEGDMGIGPNFGWQWDNSYIGPTQRIDVEGNARLRNVPAQGGESLILGLQQGTTASDIVFSRLGFPNDSTQVLLGDGTWGTAPAGGVGNYCGEASNPLTDHYEVPLNGFNYHFTGQGGNGLNHVSIGWPCTIMPGFTPPQAKLDVLELGFYQTFATPISVAGRFWSIAPSGTNHSFGVMGIAEEGSVLNCGVYGTATGGTQNWAGFFDGDVLAASYQISDENLKENIEDYTSANDILSQLRPVSYHFRTSEYPQLNLDIHPQIGLISQEVEQVLPSAVKEATSIPKFNSEGETEYESVTFKALSYEKFIPILIGGHQKQTSDIQILKQENEELRNEVALLNDKVDQLINCLQNQFPDLCRIEQGMIQENTNNQEKLRHIIDVELINGTSIVLNQNVPNPFAESTVITFTIPESIKTAQIIFHAATGALIKTVDIRERGNGQINVYANDLSTGAYTYSLVADDKIVATKRMTKQ